MSSTTMSSVLNTKLSFACNCTTIQHGPTISEDGLTVRVQQTIKLFHVVIPSPSAGSAPSLNSPLRPLVHPTKNPLSSLLFNERSPHPLQVHPTKGGKNRLSLTTSIYTSNIIWIMEVLTLMNHHGISLTKSIQRLNY